MKIALIGYGKMGKTIERIAQSRGHKVTLKVSSKDGDNWYEKLSEVDVAIEFTRPESAVKNIKQCFVSGVPVVVGTTGWYSDYNEVKKQCTEHRGALLAATNFSVGVNIFFEINKRLAELMSSRNEYTAEVQEIHHTEKLDSPSGTAITIAENIIENHSNYNNWKNSPTEVKSDLEIISYREQGVPGTHEVTFDSDIDSISIKHEAKSRDGFALGAVLAAEFIHNKKGIFSMEDVLKN